MIYYKIRKKSDPALYVKGTPYYHSYDGTGRIFQKLGQLRSFITQIMSISERKNVDLSDWEVVELEMVVKETKNIHEIITAKKLKELIMK